MVVGLATVARTWRIYGTRITGPVTVPLKHMEGRLYGPFCMGHVRVSQILLDFYFFQSSNT